MEEEIKRIIRECDLAIKREDFDTLLSHYTEDAVLVVKPGLVAKGKKKIRDAFVAIAKYFNNSLLPDTGKYGDFRRGRYGACFIADVARGGQGGVCLFDGPACNVCLYKVCGRNLALCGRQFLWNGLTYCKVGLN